MLYCTYHPKNPGVVQCNQCGRRLCSACDHRIRGFPFCQDCIVAGVELLRHESQSSSTSVSYRNSSPFVATLLSVVPGLGAAYNGQTAKAIVHFAIFASFFQMAVLTQGVPFFILGVFGTWLFAAVDACRTAQLMRAGLTPDTEEDVIMRRLTGILLPGNHPQVSSALCFCCTRCSGFNFPCVSYCRLRWWRWALTCCLTTSAGAGQTIASFALTRDDRRRRWWLARWLKRRALDRERRHSLVGRNSNRFLSNEVPSVRKRSVLWHYFSKQSAALPHSFSS